MSTAPDTTPDNPQPAGSLALPSCSAVGFWRSPRGDNHGRDSRPGDVWAEAGDITDTDRLNWLIKQGPPGVAEGQGLNEETWAVATMHAGEGRETDAEAVRAAIDAAMVVSSPNTGDDRRSPNKGPSPER